MQLHQKNITQIFKKQYSFENTLQAICDYLKNEIPKYDWVGFYFKNGNKNELKLAQFAEKPT